MSKKVIFRQSRHIASSQPSDLVAHIAPSDRFGKLVELCELAPLHNPHSLDASDAATAALPDMPHVACFDTPFYHTMLRETQAYAVPHEWTEQWKIRRYGFHGLSHSYCAAPAAKMLRPQNQPLRIVKRLGAAINSAC